jgi:hypothetical protein
MILISLLAICAQADPVPPATPPPSALPTDQQSNLKAVVPRAPMQQVLSPEGLRAAERGLKFLAEHQLENGAWPGDVGYKLEDGYRVWNYDAPHTGVTALAGMAFLAGGHVPGRGPYGKVVEKATDFLLKQIRHDGYITANETRMYSHAFATLFLAEVYGMNQREDVRGALQKAADLIVASQNQQGGWRYQPHVADADMSVAACQVMALRAARNIGIQVPRKTIDRAVKYVRDSAVREQDSIYLAAYSEPGMFRYQPAPRSRASEPLTAAGITILHGAGVYADADIERGISVLDRRLKNFSDTFGKQYGGHYYFYYGHYYAVQAYHIVGGKRYRDYFRMIESILLEMQSKDGSWPNRIGPGTIYGTATACLILQIPREYLPIFQR